MHIYAIRHKPTGNFLPSHGRKSPRIRGFSFDEPELDGGLYGPRFFILRKAVISALALWLMGKHIRKSSGGGGMVIDDYKEWIDIESQPHRKKDEMEIVEFELVETNNG